MIMTKIRRILFDIGLKIVFPCVNEVTSTFLYRQRRASDGSIGPEITVTEGWPYTRWAIWMPDMWENVQKWEGSKAACAG